MTPPERRRRDWLLWLSSYRPNDRRFGARFHSEHVVQMGRAVGA